MKVCYCKQASGGAVPLLRNQETPGGTTIWQRVGVRVRFTLTSKSRRRWFFRVSPMSPACWSWKTKLTSQGCFPLLPSVARQAFSSFLFLSEAVVWSQVKNTEIGLCCPDENPAGKPTAKWLCIHYCGKWVSDTNSLLAYKTVHLT